MHVFTCSFDSERNEYTVYRNHETFCHLSSTDFYILEDILNRVGLYVKEERASKLLEEIADEVYKIVEDEGQYGQGKY